MGALDLIGRSLLGALAMLWATLWALVLGFTISGAVQAFVSRSEMQRALGNHRPRTVGKAGAFGMASSSCSYAAAALAKTLFARGADLTAAMAFMFASTNLVIELGLVLWLLAGWQFALAELVGGVLMVALLAVVLPRVVHPGEEQAARARLQEGPSPGTPEPGDAGRSGTSAEREEGGGAPLWRRRLTSPAAWSDAAGYTLSDLGMVRREIAIGFVVAGFAAVAVPLWFWRALFWTGHGMASAVENALIGPLLAILSFVCSIGNVPLAAALWTDGISFGGVIAFVFADLVTLPLLLIYRRYYGGALTAKLLVVFWGVMSTVGLLTGEIFTAAGLVPGPGTARPGMVGGFSLAWSWTTVLDLLALVVLAAILVLRRRARHPAAPPGAPEREGRLATDPVCGMQVERALAPATCAVGQQRYWFCSDRCAERFADWRDAAQRRAPG